ncbi:MAG: hypothetical protein V2A69_05165 [Pseudomonadota bacterium]
MSFDWSEYLNLANELGGKPGDPVNREARLRSAVSRAYYAAHCIVRNYLRDLKGDANIPKDGRAHSYVIDQFRFEKENSRKRIGLNLGRLLVDRNKADYRDTVSGIEPMTQADLSLAQQIIRWISSLK